MSADLDFDNLIDKLDTLANNAKKLNGTHEIPATELFGKNFLSKCTNDRFTNFADFIDAGNFSASSFEDIPKKDLDYWVSQVTNFDSWQSMLSSAVNAYISKTLGL